MLFVYCIFRIERSFLSSFLRKEKLFKRRDLEKVSFIVIIIAGRILKFAFFGCLYLECWKCSLVAEVMLTPLSAYIGVFSIM